MNAFLWKKYKDISSSHFKVMLFLLIPIVLYTFLLLHINNYNIIIIFFPMIITMFSSMFYWDVEDIINSELILSTNLNMKLFWKWNSLLITIIGYLYGIVVLIIGTVIFKFLFHNNIAIDLNTLFLFFTGIVFSYSMIALASLQYLDFSKKRQYLSVPFSITGTISPLLLYFFGNKITINIAFTYCIVIITAILFILAFAASFRVTNEKLITNIQKLAEGYSNNIMND